MFIFILFFPLKKFNKAEAEEEKRVEMNEKSLYIFFCFRSQRRMRLSKYLWSIFEDWKVPGEMKF